MYFSSILVTRGMRGEPAPAFFAPLMAAGRRTALSKLPLAVIC